MCGYESHKCSNINAVISQYFSVIWRKGWIVNHVDFTTKFLMFQKKTAV
jgi:hypothetical protein